jgi:hypothetical protein
VCQLKAKTKTGTLDQVGKSNYAHLQYIRSIIFDDRRRVLLGCERAKVERALQYVHVCDKSMCTAPYNLTHLLIVLFHKLEGTSFYN